MNDETQTTGQPVPADDADTTSTQTSEATVQTNTDAPEASQEVKETATEATDTAEDKLYAGKYKSAEDLEKGYTELQSKFGKETSEKAELTRILNEAFATPDTPVADTASEVYDESPQINPELEQLKVKVAIGEFTQIHPDADPLAVNEIIKNDPLVANIQGAEARLEYAYLRSKNMSQPKAIEEAKKTAQAETQAKTAEKQAAQVESAAKAEPVDDSGDLMDRATGNHPKDVRDAARLDIIRKNLVNL